MRTDILLNVRERATDWVKLQKTIETKYRTIWLRAGARLIDGVLFGVALLIVSLLFMVMGLFIDDILEMVFYILFPVYNAWFLFRYGQTLGKGVTKVKVVARNKKHLGFWRPLLRETIILVSFAFSKILGWFHLGINHKVLSFLQMTIIIVFFAILTSDEKRRSYHDMAANTEVVKVS